MEKVAAVVVTYNRKDILIECIKKLKAQTVPLDILVIDNASTDGTDKLFTKSEEHIRYFNTGANLGGAGGFSFGIKKAVELKYQFIWVLDDDTLPNDTALEALLFKDAELEGQYGFLSSKVLWKDDTVCTMNIQKRTKWNPVKDFDSEQSIQYASFVSLFLRADTVRKVGLPYKEFFIWSDDWEYTRRISKTMKSYYVPSSVVTHWCKNNVGANIIATDSERMDRFKFLYRNDVVLYREDGFDGWMYLTIRLFVHKLRIIKSGSSTKEKMQLINEAIAEGRKFYPVIEFPENIE